MSRLEQSGLKQELTAIKARPATLEELSLVHDRQHIAGVQETAKKGGGWLDADTMMSQASYEAALYAAGGAIEAAAAVVKGEVDSAFALVRPPGHHATPHRAMGFCLFNNAAIAARYALTRLGLERVLIIDFDVHHGNGTQDAFYDDPSVLYVSTHEYPFYPGSGGIEETGRGAGEGTTLNIPLPAGCGDAEYLQAFEEIIVPATRRYRPQLVLVSAGYDPHWADDLALMQLSVTGFARMVTIIKGLTGELCRGRLALVLEGGYNLDALADSVKATFDVLLGKGEIEDPLGPSPRAGQPGIAPLLRQVARVHGLA
ncbi:MAG: histone deacetylase [Chloroflexi bacterium]|nr:histone deacetylase [Chloroflexota bacterium]